MKFSISKKANICYRYVRLLALIMSLSFLGSSYANAIPALDLKSTANFVILAGSTVTGIPPVSIIGNVGLSPAAGSFVIGFDGTNVDGTIYVVDASGPAGSVQNATLLQTAKSDLTTAYNDAANRTPVPTGPFLNPGGGNIGGMNLVPGLYKFTSGALITGADVTLTGSNTDVWIFQIASSLGLGSDTKIILAGGAQAANVFWQVGTSATIGTYSTFKGTILADQSISMGTGASFEGRALAFTGAVTFGAGLDTKRSDLFFPEFSANKDTLNFGNVANGSSKMDSINVTNIGDADLIIDSVRSPNSVFTITPSSSATIAKTMTKKYYVTYSPINGSTNNGYVYFYHNDPSKKDSIYVTGSNAVPIFTANKDTLNFGNVSNGNTKKDSVTVTNTGTSNLVISSITISNSAYTIDANNATIIAGASKKFYVTFAPLTDNLNNGTIIFNHNDPNQKDTVFLIGNGVSPKFTVNKRNLDFGDVKTGTSKVDSVIVTNTGTSNLDISSIIVANSIFKVNIAYATLAPNQSKTVVVTFTPDSDGNKTGSIIFKHNATTMQDTVFLTGRGVSPQFAVNKTSLNFGDVKNGTSKTDSVTISNTGTSDLIVSSITSTNSIFTTNIASVTLAPNQSRVIIVTFAPLSDGSKSGNIVFNHNGTSSPNIVSVTGKGVSPKFSVDLTNLDFGDVRNGTTSTKSVTVSNPGTYNLTISSITSSNGVYTVMPTSAVVAPGESVEIDITFAPLVDGVQNGNISFIHDALGSPSVVTVTGNGVSPKFSSDVTNIDFGNVRNGTTLTKSVTISNPGTYNLTISSIISSNSLYTVSSTSEVIAPGKSVVIDITFAPLVDSVQNGNIIFNNDALSSPNIITVTGRGVSPQFSADVAHLNFGDVRNGTTKTLTIRVSNPGTSDLTISSILSSNKYYTVSSESEVIAPGESVLLYVTFAPLVDGEQNGEIVFNHDALSNPNIITVTGTGGSPHLTTNRIYLDFGDVTVGQSKMDSVVITNTGIYDLEIFGSTITNKLFTMTPATGYLAPGASQTFYITFTPTENGSRHGYVYFNSTSWIQDYPVSVKGNGVSPRFTINPLSLNFGMVRVGTSKTQNVVVTNTGNANLILSAISQNTEVFNIAPTNVVIEPGGSREFSVTFTPKVDGLVFDFINFMHNAPNGNDWYSVSGIGGDDHQYPIFTVDISSLDFGTVIVGDSKQKSVRITNTGQTDLNITNITSSEVHYQILESAMTIAPGEFKDFFITFAPTAVGRLNALIEFTHNAGKDIVSVTGKGIKVISISDARKLPLGTEVAIDGVVTRTLGSYTRIQDATAALTIVQTSGALFEDIKISEIKMTDKIRVLGTISEINHLLVIAGSDLESYERISRDNTLPAPAVVTLSQLASNGEQYESQLVSLVELRLKTIDDLNFLESTTYLVSDPTDATNAVSIRIGADADTYMNNMPYFLTGSYIGVLSQTSQNSATSGYELTPVLSTDLFYIVSGVMDNENPSVFSLSENYPNPFSKSSTIEFDLVKSDFVSLKIIDELGNIVKTIIDNNYVNAGNHSVTFTIDDNSQVQNSGVYFYRLNVGQHSSTKAMMFVK